MLIYKLVNHKLVNHSDPWMFKAADNKIAFLVALYVGNGQTPAERDGWSSGFFFGGKQAMGNVKKAYKREFDEDFDGAIDRHRDDVAAACLTFMINRDAKYPWIEPGTELDEWNNAKRSSMNNAGAKAKFIAANLFQAKVVVEETEEKIPIEEIPAFLEKLTAERDALKTRVETLEMALNDAVKCLEHLNKQPGDIVGAVGREIIHHGRELVPEKEAPGGKTA